MEQFVNGMKKENNWKKTENGADALKSTMSYLVDLFGTIGALRNQNQIDIEMAFSRAFHEDTLLALKMSFYARNIRGGLGERRTPRIIWKFLAELYPEIMRKNLHLIPEFGRWDDLYIFVDTELEKDMWELMSSQFYKDIDSMNRNESVSLLAKWMKSINTSSKESVILGKKTAQALGMSEKEYRKTLSKLRKYIDIVECKMAQKKWNEIEYQKVPSNAMNRYRRAFSKNDAERFCQYLQDVKSGRKEIKSGTLYPYDIVEKILYKNEYNEVLEQQWNMLPNYIEGENNVVIMADVSGSMYGRPMATSVGLAIYFSERNKGVFNNKFMTFSHDPQFVDLVGDSLYEKIYNAVETDWGMNTNIQKAMEMILRVGVANHLSDEDMPKSLIIISDMEFDSATCNNEFKENYYDKIKSMFNENGFEIPNIVFWNVDARQNTFHAESNVRGVQMASGHSASVFKSLLSGMNYTPYELMMEVLSDSQYNEISL